MSYCEFSGLVGVEFEHFFGGMDLGGIGKQLLDSGRSGPEQRGLLRRACRHSSSVPAELVAQ